jgi:hypothetical protein
MSKSNYPGKLDTSVEIPSVRDNITEIGSDVLNSIRSAIFNIERTLGINPQGAAGNTVAARLGNLIDDNGNIIESALDRAGILSGPITNEDVSKVAAIDESKLRLNFPTHLLQDEISILDNKIELFIAALDELNKILSAHIHPEATNRHKAKAITATEAESVASAIATLSLSSGTVQAALEALYDAHINFTGENLTASNNSHKALQLYYDNSETSDIIPSDDVQGAIDDLVNLEGVGLRKSILNLNSNGIVRTGDAIDAYEKIDSGSILVASSEISFPVPTGGSKTIISFTNSPSVISEIKEFDVLEILNATVDSDNTDYLISSVTLDASGDLSQVEVYGGPKNALTTGTTARVKKSVYTTYNENALNCAVRPRLGFSNTPTIQVCLPNSATIISSGARPENIVSGTSDTLAIEVDEETTYEIDISNSNYTVQTLDIVIATINQYCAENKLNFFAYKLKALNCYELALSHNIPNHADDVRIRSLKIVDASSNDASAAMGLSYIKDRLTKGAFGNSVHINGMLIDDFGKVITHNSESISIGTGTLELNAKGATDFLASGIRVGDLVVIDGSSDSDDDGSYSIKTVEATRITLDFTSTLQGSLSETSAVFILRSGAPISELNFIELDGLMMLDIFADDNANIHFKKRLDIVGHMSLSNFYATVKDVTQGFITSDQEYTLKVDTSGMATLKQEPSGTEGPEVFVGSTGEYKVLSNDGMNYVVLSVFVPNESIAAIGASDLTSSIFGFDELPSSTLHLCRTIFSPEFGVVIEEPDAGLGGKGALSTTDKRTTGTADDTIISSSFIERYIQGPRNELRGSGLIRGISVKSIVDNGDGTSTLNIDPGVGVVNGIRIEYLGDAALTYRHTNGATDNFYVGLNGEGCIVIGNEVDPNAGTDYISPFYTQNVAHLAYIDLASLEITDLRLFVDHLDYKLVADITVSNDTRFGHFASLQSAVKYAEMFSKMFPDVGTPSIFVKEGTYELTEKLTLNFDVKIHGTGPTSIIKRASTFPLSNFSILAQGHEMVLIGADTGSSSIQYGVDISNLTFEGITGQPTSKSGTVFRVTNNITNTGATKARFKFDGLRFIAAADYSSSAAYTGAENEMPFHIGNDSGGTYQNIIIQNCYFDGVGYQQCVAYLNQGNTFKNILITDNISQRSIDVAGGYTLLQENSATNTLSGILEVNNIIEAL